MTNGPAPDLPEHLIGAPNGATTPAGGSLAARPQALARSLLADGEIVILEFKPSLWFIPLVSAPVVGLGLIVMLAENVPAVARLCPGGGRVLCSVGLWIVGLRLVWAALQWFGRTYVLTDRRVIRQKGVLNIQVFECRLDRLQNTFISRTLVQRVLGIGTILFATAGTGQVEAMWQHIGRSAEVHKRVVEAAERFRRRNGPSQPL